MKKTKYIIPFICVIIGVIFTTDLLVNLDAQTGFYQDKYVYVRYLLLAVFIIGLWVISKKLPKENKSSVLHCSAVARVSLLCFVGWLACFVVGVVMLYTKKAEITEYILPIGFLIGSFWVLGIGVKMKSWILPAVALFIVHLISSSGLFINSTYSAHYPEPTIEVVCFTLPIIFIANIIMCFEGKTTEKNITDLYFTSIMTFFVTVCVYLPLQIWEVINKQIETEGPLKALYLTLLGVFALVVFIKLHSTQKQDQIQPDVVEEI